MNYIFAKRVEREGPIRPKYKVLESGDAINAHLMRLFLRKEKRSIALISKGEREIQQHVTKKE